METQELSVCIAGATGWTGRALVPAVLDAPDLRLGSAVSRSAAGETSGGARRRPALGVPVHASVREALDGIDVLIDYTSATAVKANTLAAIDAGAAVVIGSSGLTAADFGEIDSAARERSVGVVGVGELLAHRRDVPGRSPAGGAPPAAVGGHRLRQRDQARRPLGHRARARGAPRRDPPPGARAPHRGPPRAPRGARRRVGGTQVHSVRLPSFVVSTEVVFGLPDERLTHPP